MGFFEKAFGKIRENMANKYSKMSGINRTLCSKEYALFVENIKAKEDELERDLKLNSNIMAFKDQPSAAPEIEEYVDSVSTIKKDCANELNQINNDISYTDIRSAKEMKDLITSVDRKVDKAAQQSKEEAAKVSESIFQKITNKLKSLVVKPEASIDLRSVYSKADAEKKIDELDKMQQNVKTVKQDVLNRMNAKAPSAQGSFKTMANTTNTLSSMESDIKKIREQNVKELNEYLKTVDLEVLAQVNKKLYESSIGFMLESDGMSKNATPTLEQMERQRDKVMELRNEVDERIHLAEAALNTQREGIKAFDAIRLNPSVRDSYTVVDMQALGLWAMEQVERKNCIVMMSDTMQQQAVANNGKGQYPAVFVIDHDGAVHTYDSYEQCDMAKHIGIADDAKRNVMWREGRLQIEYGSQGVLNNAHGYSMNGQVEAYINYVRDYVREKDKLQALSLEAERVSGARFNGMALSSDSQDLMRMAREREAAENLSPFLFDSNFDFIRDASAEVAEKLAPLVIDIKHEMEAREGKDHGQLLTGTKLRAKTEYVMGENGQEFAPVLVLSASITSKDRAGFDNHPTMNIVCDINGDLKSVYYSEEYHDTNAAYLGNKLADREHGIDFSLYSNNATVRTFLNEFPSIKETIDNNFDLSKFYDTRNITLDDIKKTVEEVERDDV